MPRGETVCKRVYLDEAGTEYHNMPSDPSIIVAQEFRFTNNEIRVIDLDAFNEGVSRGAMWHGFNQTHGDVFAGVKGDVDEAVALFDARHATLEGGVWTSRAAGGGGKTDSILAEAMLAYFEEEGKTETKDGTLITAAWVRGFLLAEDVEDDEVKETRSTRAKSWKANADVRAHYDNIRAAREDKKAESVDASGLDDI